MGGELIPGRLLKKSQASTRQSYRVLLTPLTYIHVGEAKTGEEAQCTRQYMSILSRFLTPYCAA
jgi:hypothetical protein